MTNQECADRIEDAVRSCRVFFDADDTVTIYCEDVNNPDSGKKYLFVIKQPLQFYKNLFEINLNSETPNG